jgi:hypothetical protein
MSGLAKGQADQGGIGFPSQWFFDLNLLSPAFGFFWQVPHGPFLGLAAVHEIVREYFTRLGADLFSDEITTNGQNGSRPIWLAEARPFEFYGEWAMRIQNLDREREDGNQYSINAQSRRAGRRTADPRQHPGAVNAPVGCPPQG